MKKSKKSRRNKLAAASVSSLRKPEPDVFESETLELDALKPSALELDISELGVSGLLDQLKQDTTPPGSASPLIGLLKEKMKTPEDVTELVRVVGELLSPVDEDDEDDVQRLNQCLSLFKIKENSENYIAEQFLDLFAKGRFDFVDQAACKVCLERVLRAFQKQPQLLLKRDVLLKLLRTFHTDFLVEHKILLARSYPAVSDVIQANQELLYLLLEDPQTRKILLFESSSSASSKEQAVISGYLNHRYIYIFYLESTAGGAVRKLLEDQRLVQKLSGDLRKRLNLVAFGDAGSSSEEANEKVADKAGMNHSSNTSLFFNRVADIKKDKACVPCVGNTTFSPR